MHVYAYKDFVINSSLINSVILKSSNTLSQIMNRGHHFNDLFSVDL